MLTCWILAILGILNFIILCLIYKTANLELERIKEFKQMYRREMENFEALREENNNKIDDLNKKIDDINSTYHCDIDTSSTTKVDSEDSSIEFFDL